MDTLASRYADIQKTIGGRANLIAVSKTKSIELIRELYELGQRDFGENKVQELALKSESLKDLKNIRWHFIGTLQKNKLNQLLKVVNLFAIHSVDKLSLVAAMIPKSYVNKVKVFLQVNTSDESEKSGFHEKEQILAAYQQLKEHSCFEVCGLMTIGKMRTDNFEGDAKACFKELVSLKKDLEIQLKQPFELSMGMSSDYLIAIDNQSDWVRIGSSIFGKRE